MLHLLWLTVIILLILIFIFYFKIKNITVVNLLLGLLGVCAMLAIALQTFRKMDISTRETIEVSRKQIEELKSTSITLDSVARSLKIISEDVVVRQNQTPNLYVTFVKNQNQIDLRAGEECQIEFWLHNKGVISANNPTFRIFFPSEIEIVDKGNFDLAQQGPTARHANHNGLYRNKPLIRARIYDSQRIKIKTERTNVGLVEIPCVCSGDAVPESLDKLLINFIG